MPVFDAISPAASSSMMSSDDGTEPTTNSESNNGDINFDDFLRFLDGYTAEMPEQDKMSGPPGWYSLEGLSCYVHFSTRFSCVLCTKTFWILMRRQT